MKRNHFIALFIILSCLGAGTRVSKAADDVKGNGPNKSWEIVPNISVRANTQDIYEVALGYVHYSNSGIIGYSLNAAANHNKAGPELTLLLKQRGNISNSVVGYTRFKMDYYWNVDSLNRAEFKNEVYGVDVGIGISGHSPLLNIYVGYRHGKENDKWLIGIGMNL